MAASVHVDDPSPGVVRNDQPVVPVDAAHELQVAAEVSIGGGSTPDSPDELAAWRELRQRRARVVHHVDVAFMIDGQAARFEELGLAFSEAAELADEVPLRCEDLDATVSAVRDVDRAVRAADCHLPVDVVRVFIPSDEAELAAAAAEFPPTTEDVPARRDDAHPLARIGYVEVAVWTDRQRTRIPQPE